MAGSSPVIFGHSVTEDIQDRLDAPEAGARLVWNFLRGITESCGSAA